jgi:hypothetical protein
MKILLFCLLTLLFFNSGFGQLQIKLPIWRIDSIGQTDTAYFGVDEQATYCLDPELGEGEIWWQACGLVPCLAFIDVRDGLEACLGEGTMIDLRPYYSTAQIDTYKLKFDGYLPIVFHWDTDIPNSYESMLFMNNADTNLATIKINMIAQDSLVLTSYGMNGWWIRTESPNPVTNIKFQYIDSPNAPQLLQNYPNPFNPLTTICFTLTHESIVTITIFDVLGREVKSAVKDQRFNQGTHNLDFDAKELSSGIYFYRMVIKSEMSEIEEFTYSKKMIICK